MVGEPLYVMKAQELLVKHQTQQLFHWLMVHMISKWFVFLMELQMDGGM
jgi:hypothetical protein